MAEESPSEEPAPGKGPVAAEPTPPVAVGAAPVRQPARPRRVPLDANIENLATAFLRQGGGVLRTLGGELSLGAEPPA